MNLTPEEINDLVPLARAAVGGETENLWDQVASFFQKTAKEAADVVEPRPDGGSR